MGEKHFICNNPDFLINLQAAHYFHAISGSKTLEDTQFLI